MKANRKKAEDFLVETMRSLTPNGGNGDYYKAFLGAMDDTEFDKYVTWLENGGDITVWLSNTDRKDDVDFEHIVKLCKDLGVPVMQRIVSYDIDTGLKNMTDKEHFVGTAELMQQGQMWAKKVSAAKDDTKVEDLTGQVMMESRATGFSVPEVSVMGLSLGLDKAVGEIYSVKGGDLDALKAYRTDLIETGKTNTKEVLARGTAAKSLVLVHKVLRARMLDNNLDKRHG